MWRTSGRATESQTQRRCRWPSWRPHRWPRLANNPSPRPGPPRGSSRSSGADGNSLGRVVAPTMGPSRTALARCLNPRWGARRGLCAPDGTLAVESVSRGYHATSARFRAPLQCLSCYPPGTRQARWQALPFPGAAKGPSCRDPLGGRNRKRLSVRRRGASGDFSASCGAKFI